MNQIYHLEWIDSLTTNTLNPVKSDLSSISDQELAVLSSQIAIEKDKARFLIINQTFSSKTESHLILLIKMYRHALIFLLNTISKNYKLVPLSHQSDVLENTYKELTACLDELLSYIELRFSDQVHAGEILESKNVVKMNKVFCAVSADQISIFLRAGIDLKILNAASFSAVYREIVPHLSSLNRDELSWKSMRGNAHECETRDQNIVIELLEKMIEKIKEY